MKSSDIEVCSMSKSLKKIAQLEKKHRVIADNLIDTIWSLDVETLKFDYIAPSIERISGYTADEYMNFTLQERLTPESFQKVTAILAEEIPRFEQGVKTIRTLELEFLHKNGNTYWAEIRVKFIKEAGKSLKIIGVSIEISDRKKAEQQQNELIKMLRDVEDRYRALLDNFKDAVYEITGKDEFTYMNQSAVNLFGYSKDKR